MILFKKTIRSMLRNKKAYISCIILMMFGGLMYMCMGTAVEIMDQGKDEYYEENNLGDGFATVLKMPDTALYDLENIEGIDVVNGRIVEEVRIYDSDDTAIKTLKLISSPIGEKDRLNSYVSTGSDLTEYNDILLGQDFYEGYNYIEGDSLDIVGNGSIENFTVRGGIYSPEYVYLLKDPTALFNDNMTYNFAYAGEEYMGNIFDMQGFYNDISFTLQDGYEYEDVENDVKYVLDKYGLVSLYPVDDLLSYSYMELEMDTAGSMSSSVAIVFIGMSSIILYLMLKRIIEKDRTQIGTLKAFGYSSSQIISHYLMYGIITGAIGGVVSVLVSVIGTAPMLDMYLVFFHLPIEAEINIYNYFIEGFIITVLGGVIGAYFGVYKLIKLNPSEAMKPEAPKVIKKDVLEYIPFIKKIITEESAMGVRNITRNKLRSAFVVLGITFSFGIMAFVGVMADLMDTQFFGKYDYIYKYDGKIILEEYADYDESVYDVSSSENINDVEGVLSQTVSLSNGFKTYGTSITGLRDDSYLYKIYDESKKINLKINDSGLILNNQIADNLDVSVGDKVLLSSPYLEDDKEVIVSQIVTQTGMESFMNIDYLNSIFGMDNQINNIVFTTDDMENARSEIIQGSNVKDMYEKEVEEQSLRELMGMSSTMINIMAVIGIIISFIIIYNSAIISLSERSREYATLRVLGFSIKNVKKIMNNEYWILAFIGIIFGIPFAKLLLDGMNTMIDIDTFQFPETLEPKSYIIASIGIIISVIISNYMGGKAIQKLELVDVLKERE